MFNIDNEYIVKIRREIHAYPEVDFDLPNTVKIVERELDAIGITYTEKYGKGSVVGYINPDKEGFTIGIRADMDALNIQEANDVPYRSKIDGKMHACGHDAHTAILLGAAKALKEMEDSLSCRVKLLFQPSEEGVKSGAMMMVENGVMEDVDVIIGLHTENALEAGTLAVCKGSSQASSRNFKIEIFGESAHIADPQYGKDALAAAVRMYNDIQFVMCREVDPMARYVCGIGKMKAGTAQNNIADYAYMQGTIRTFDMKIDNQLITRIEKIAQSIENEMGVKIKITAPAKSLVLYNDPYISDLVTLAMEKVVGKENVGVMLPKLGSEDFSRYLAEKKGVLFRLGTKNEAKGITSSAHNDDFELDEDILHLGAETFVQFVLDNMNGINF